jgi:hypothetical protein
MKTLIEFILNRLVNFPEEVVVDEEINDTSETYTISVNPEDIGRVIGKQGSVINAIRTIAKIKAMKDGVHVTVNVADQ